MNKYNIILNILKNINFFVSKRYNYNDNKIFLLKELIFIKFFKIKFLKSKITLKIILIKYYFFIIKKIFDEYNFIFLFKISVYIKIIIKNIDDKIFDILKIKIAIFYNLIKNKNNKFFSVILNKYRELFSISI